MQRVRVSFAVVLTWWVAGCGGGDAAGPATSSARDHVFVADEDSGTVSVIEETKNTLLASIVLPTSPDMYMPHNVQAAPDGKSVWVAAAPMTEGGMEKAFVIDPESNQLVGDIELGTGSMSLMSCSIHHHLAPTSANEGNAVLGSTRRPGRSYAASIWGPIADPGMRWCRDQLWIANMTAKNLARLDPASATVSEIDVGGVAVQTACAPSGRYVFVSLYDTKEVVRYEIDTQQLTRIALPAESQGPVQLLSFTRRQDALGLRPRALLLGRPASNRLYALDVEAAKVVGTVFVGQGAHGVVLSDDGGLAYVTNLSDNSVSVVDTAKMETVATIAVGTKPNGISHWHRNGAMP
ncbi:MAG: hypothetical protein IPI67_08005 [Myxococcales bacterium]|nr:hypothetical protein [Myxococcales bacterium]